MEGLFTGLNLAFLLGLGVLSAVLAWRWPFGVLGGFLLLALVFEALIRWGAGPLDLPVVGLAGIARSVALLFMALAIGVRSYWRPAAGQGAIRWQAADILLGLVLAISALAVVLSPDRMAGVAAFRNYFQPVLVFYLVRMLRPTRRQLSRLIGVWLLVGLGMAAFGMLQWVAWDQPDYARFGYVLRDGELDVARVTTAEGMVRVRPPSTVTGPNEFGLQMVLMALAAGLFGSSTNGWRRLALLLLAVGLAMAHMYSFSRSALLGMLTAGGVLLLFLITDARRRDLRHTLRRPWMLALVVGLVVILLGVLLASGMGNRLVRTAQRLPQEYHVRDTVQAIEYLAEHPLGAGMGLVGPREGAYFPKVYPVSVEGSLFQIAIDTSIVGLALWIAFFGVSLGAVWRAWRSLSDTLIWPMAALAFCGWIAALTTFLILPLIQSFSLMAWLWFLLGFALAAEDLERLWRVRGDYRPIGEVGASVPAA